MKKTAVMLALLLVIGTAPGWCLVEMVDHSVDNHTKTSTMRPVQDAGEIYGAVNHGIGESFDKVPVLKERSVVMNPINKLMGDTLDASKKLINGTWDLLTFKSMREKK